MMNLCHRYSPDNFATYPSTQFSLSTLMKSASAPNSTFRSPFTTARRRRFVVTRSPTRASQRLLANGKRIEELSAKRTQLQTDLAEIDAELAELLAGNSVTGGRAAQKCSKCGQVGHSKRTCPQGKE